MMEMWGAPSFFASFSAPSCLDPQLPCECFCTFLPELGFMKCLQASLHPFLPGVTNVLLASPHLLHA